MNWCWYSSDYYFWKQPLQQVILLVLSVCCKIIDTFGRDNLDRPNERSSHEKLDMNEDCNSYKLMEILGHAANSLPL